MKETTNATEKRLVTASRLSSLISIPIYTIRQMERENILPAYRINSRKFLFATEEVIQTIKEIPAN